MTTINREVTREKEKTKTVQTCDVCGLSEMEMNPNATIDSIKSGLNTSMKYHLYVQELDGVDGQAVSADELVFDDLEEATAHVSDLDMDMHSIDKYSTASMSWDLNIDACTRCQKMMFGALRDDFSMKSV